MTFSHNFYIFIYYKQYKCDVKNVTALEYVGAVNPSSNLSLRMPHFP